jgi:hypothetical protein
MGIAGIITFIALAAAPPTDVHTEPPCGGSSSVRGFATMEQVDKAAPMEQLKQYQWLGLEVGGAFIGLVQPGRPGTLIFSRNSASLGIHDSSASVQSFGLHPDRPGVSAAEAQSDLSTFDTVVFARRGFPTGTAFPARVELSAYAVSIRDFGEAEPRDDGRVTLRSTLASDMLPQPLTIAPDHPPANSPTQPFRAGRDVTLRTGVEYRIRRALHASVSTVRVGANQIARCGGSIQSRVAICPLVPDVTLKSCASIYYFPCPGDLDTSWFIDDADFSLFAASYDLGDCSLPEMPAGCPADLNFDGFVTPDDLVLFFPWYDEMYCYQLGEIDLGPQ